MRFPSESNIPVFLFTMLLQNVVIITISSTPSSSLSFMSIENYAKTFMHSHYDLTNYIKADNNNSKSEVELEVKSKIASEIDHNHRRMNDQVVELREGRLEDDSIGSSIKTCDVQFMSCLKSDTCRECFSDMNDNDIEWSMVAKGTKCQDVLETVSKTTPSCLQLQMGTPESDVFCQTFDSCVIWSDEEDNEKNDMGESDDDEKGESKNESIDCNTLISCEFEGFKPSYIGDGICHDFIGGCYNSNICNYDGGDCCEDTCQDRESALVGCGSEGFKCIDPKSANCTSTQCRNDEDNENDDKDDGDKPSKPKDANCANDEIPYRLYQYDSFGDGWDLTEMMILDSKENVIYDGGLEDGSEGLEYLCLQNAPECYNVQLFGGYWGNEVSWEIKPMKNGAPGLASGGSPMDCNFAIGDTCDSTCDGKPNIDPEEDEKYKSYHMMANCIEEKCVIQLSTCETDMLCRVCLDDISPGGYCLANEFYNALIFCTECSCVEDMGKEEKKLYCEEKSRLPDEHQDIDLDDDYYSNYADVQSCGFSDYTAGTSAVVKYSECSGMDTVSALITNFDNDNFGALDAFETCATEFMDSRFHKSALDCMRILQKAVDYPQFDKKKENVPVDAIKSLASDLLNNGKNFCDCSAESSELAPPCLDFLNFKTLLYESLDACRALDEIDCHAWGEFYTPCQSNLLDKFQTVDLRNSDQCDYIHEGCGNVGPFPSFRRLDCEGEGVSHEAWDFYLDFERLCFKDAPPPQPTPIEPKPAPEPIYPKQTPSVYTLEPTTSKRLSPSKSNTNDKGKDDEKKPKKYIPPEQRNKEGGFFVGIFKFLFFCGIVYGAYYLYKQKFGTFDYAQFRRSRNFTADDSGMYDSLTMRTGETSFQPPSLPPGPSAYEMNSHNVA